MTDQEWQSFREKNSEYFNIHKYVFGEEPKVILGALSDSHSSIQSFINGTMRDIVNGTYGNGDTDDPYSILLKFTMPTCTAELVDAMFNKGIPFFIMSIQHLKDGTGNGPQGLTQIGGANIPGTIRKLYSTKFVWLDKVYLTEEWIGSVAKGILATILVNHLIATKSPIGIRASYNHPFIWAPERKANIAVPPEIKLSHKTISDHTAMMTMIRSQTSKDAIDRWDGTNPYDLQVIAFVPADAYHLPDAAIKLLLDSYNFFDKQYCKSRQIKTQKLSSIEDARRYLYSEFMIKGQTTLFILKDKQPIGIVEYKVKTGEPIHISRIYIYKEHRGKGYGDWIVKNLLSETYNLPSTVPYQTLRVFGSEVKKLIPFYSRYGFRCADVECEYTLESEDIKELINQLHA